MKKTVNKDHNTANTGKKVLANSNISNGKTVLQGKYVCNVCIMYKVVHIFAE